MWDGEPLIEMYHTVVNKAEMVLIPQCLSLYSEAEVS